MKYLALLELRNTPRQDVSVSPSQILFGQQTRSVIPKLIKYCSSHAMNLERRKRQESIRKQYDKTKICLLLAFEIKYIFNRRKGKKVQRWNYQEDWFTCLHNSSCKWKNVQKKPSAHTKKFGTEIE